MGGPRAVPGDYQVRLSVGSESVTERFSLLMDPRLPASLDDLRAQFNLKIAIRNRTSETNTAINQMRRIRGQVETWEKRAEASAAVKDAAKSLKEQLKGVEGELINLDFEKPRPGPNRIKEKFDALSSMIDESDDVPTRGAFELYDVLAAQLSEQLGRLRGVLDGPVKEFNDLVRAEELPPVG